MRQLIALGLLTSTTQAAIRIPRSKVMNAWLHITNACNLRCDYCYVHKTNEKMSLETGQRAIQAIFQAVSIGGYRGVKLKFSGGEALLNQKLIFALNQQARQLAEQAGLWFDSVVLSNGVAISERLITELQAHNIRLSISLDGVGKYHDVQRKLVNGQGSFKYIEQSLDRLAKHNLRPTITITVSSRNMAGLPEAVDYLLQRGLPFSLNFYRDNECSAQFNDLHYDEQRLIETLIATFNVIETNLPPFSLLSSLSDRARLDIPHEYPCAVGPAYWVIDQHGKVARCQMALEHAISDIRAADVFEKMQTTPGFPENPSVNNKEGCKVCLWRYWCAGGCPLLTHRLTGRYDLPSPNCNIYKVIFPAILRLEGLRLVKYQEQRPLL